MYRFTCTIAIFMMSCEPNSSNSEAHIHRFADIYIYNSLGGDRRGRLSITWMDEFRSDRVRQRAMEFFDTILEFNRGHNVLSSVVVG